LACLRCARRGATAFPYTPLFRSRQLWRRINQDLQTFRRLATAVATAVSTGLRLALLQADRRCYERQSRWLRVSQLLSLFVCRTQDRKSTRLNSSHVKTSYAVFCL